MTPEPPATESAGRPEDVDTGFWLWIAALPLMVIGYLIDLATARMPDAGAYIYAVSGLFVVVTIAVVATFAVLMRLGYRWPRTVLTAAGLTAVIYSVSSLFTADRSEFAAVGFAVCTIIGSVLILGGVVLLHRKDAHEYLTR
ncbi:hypothetical protein [Mycolicibacterium frederiksbergense]|uniref:Transmembrane protein n=1 Tax=Mycolicibacterium frederiksbergense TaxID=117567 RepID=A0A6H0S267_9MYCO|nr:hypothetical protein [Mycolicibacterium frederiksbergense]QIV81304.1 hypothetical protein EXE63_10695 [Mycolicibacterium frederiksbergense]